MATSAFKSTTRRSSIGTASNADEEATSSNRSRTHHHHHHRRSRSLSQFPGRFPADEVLPPKGRFVNTVRGSGFPDISLDDLANDFFTHVRETERGRSARRSSTTTISISPTNATRTTEPSSQSQRRGRSVSRQHTTRVGDANLTFPNNHNNNSRPKNVPDNNSRRRRSISVAPYQFSDSESDIENTHKTFKHGNLKSFTGESYQRPSLHKPTAPNHQRLLRRPSSQKDILKSHDGYSSQSSALTDDERDAHTNKNVIERTIRAVYAQKKTEHPTEDGVETGLHEAMRKELRHAVEEIRTEIEQVMVKGKPSELENGDSVQPNNSDVLQAVSLIIKNYTTKLEQSEKRKQDLLAKLVVEEISKVARELLPDQKKAVPEKPSRARKKSNDKSRMSKCLTEEAEKYFEDFISNVEDTDISSFDGERSDASSTLGGTTKSRDIITHCGETGTYVIPTRSCSLPVEMDGIVLPWLQWETSHDGSPLSYKSKMEGPVKPQNNLCDAAQVASTASNKSNCFTSSHGSWNPGGDSPSVVSNYVGSRFGESGSYSSQLVASEPKACWFDMDEYGQLQKSEDLLFEVWRQRQRINSGGLILCRTFL